MIVDTSALLAIILGEPGWRALASIMSEASSRQLSAASYLEAGLKLVRLDIDAVTELDRTVAQLDMLVVDVTPEQAREAVRARARYGRAPARLNFGDCLVYALVVSTGEPLLYKGDDFSHADVEAVRFTPL